MARWADIMLHSLLDEDRHGLLVTETRQSVHADVYYVPSKNRLILSELDPEKAHDYRVRVLAIDAKARTLTIYPLNTIGGHKNFRKPKHLQVERITLTDIAIPPFSTDSSAPLTQEEVMAILEELPACFSKDYDYGLGLRKAYWSIVRAVERISPCSEIRISATHETEIDTKGGTFHLSASDLDAAWKELDRIDRHNQNAARSVKEATAHNILAKQVGHASMPVRTGRDPLRKMFTEVATGQEPLTDDKQTQVIDLITKNASSIAHSRPEQFAKLRGDIELVTLESLISRFERLIPHQKDEQFWQSYFSSNPIVLSMAFGYPVIKMQEQASVGGRKFSGTGEKIVDFLAKNTLTYNAAIFEIKTPQEKLINSRSYRNGVHAPTSGLSGAISQALDQKYQLQSGIAQLKHNSDLDRFEAYAVHCCLIIGRTPGVREQRKSLEIFRRNSKDVEIVTYDELLEKLKQIRNFLAYSDTDVHESEGPKSVSDDVDVPF